MNSDPLQLLRRLNPAVRPAYAAAPPQRGASPIEHQSFDQLLKLAQGGSLVSGRQIQVGCDAQPPLEAGQLERMAEAADQVEASGARRALMMIDGRSFVLDVASRTLQSEFGTPGHAQPANPVVNVDAAVMVASLHQRSAMQMLKPPGSGAMPAGLIKTLAGSQPSAPHTLHKN
jgi:hypothetical protein